MFSEAGRLKGFLELLRLPWSWFVPVRTEADAEHNDAVLVDLEHSISNAVDGVANAEDLVPSEARNPHDDEMNLELFAGIAANYSRPVKNFIFELKRGTASKEWIEICRPVIGSIVDGAESMGLDHVVERLVGFNEALSLAEAAEERLLETETRDLILARYEAMVEVLPGAFLPGKDDRRRESIIIHSLLRQIPEVGHVTFERLYGAGLTSLEALYLARKKDLCLATGVPEWLCERICEKVAAHRKQVENASSEIDHRVQLVELVQQLRGLQEGFLLASNARRMTSELAAEKRRCLRGRQACNHQIDVLLAEMDELELVDELRKMAVYRRIERLEQYLAPVASTGAERIE
jgi:hypothetical protein